MKKLINFYLFYLCCKIYILSISFGNYITFSWYDIDLLIQIR